MIAGWYRGTNTSRATRSSDAGLRRSAYRGTQSIAVRRLHSRRAPLSSGASLPRNLRHNTQINVRAAENAARRLGHPCAGLEGLAAALVRVAAVYGVSQGEAMALLILSADLHLHPVTPPPVPAPPLPSGLAGLGARSSA